MHINGIVAVCKNGGIGLNNKLPWILQTDLQRFKKTTIGNGNNAIIMGRNTWDSIPFLNGRDHLILSKTINIDECKNNKLLKSFDSIDEVMKHCKERKYDKIWVIGGSNIYNQFIKLNLLNFLFVTYIEDDYECDVFFPKIPNNYFIVEKVVLNEYTERNKNSALIVYKQAKKNMHVLHKDSKWIIIDIHYDNYPEYYFTIRNINDTTHEKQTTPDKIKLL